MNRATTTTTTIHLQGHEPRSKEEEKYGLHSPPFPRIKTFNRVVVVDVVIRVVLNTSNKHAYHRKWLCVPGPVRVQQHDRAGVRPTQRRQFRNEVSQAGHWTGHRGWQFVVVATFDRRHPQVGASRRKLFK